MAWFKAYRDGWRLVAAVDWVLLDHGIETYSAARRVARFISQQRGYAWVGIYGLQGAIRDPATGTIGERDEPELRLLTDGRHAPVPLLTRQALRTQPTVIQGARRMWAPVIEQGELIGAIDIVTGGALNGGDLRFLPICSKALRRIYGL